MRRVRFLLREPKGERQSWNYKQDGKNIRDFSVMTQDILQVIQEKEMGLQMGCLFCRIEKDVSESGQDP